MPERGAGAVGGEERGEPAKHPGGWSGGRRAREGPKCEEQPEPGVEVVQQHGARGVAVAALPRLSCPHLLEGRLRGGLRDGRAHPARPNRSRLMRTPAASRSQLSGVTPSARNLCFSIFSVGVFGRASTMRT